MKVAIFRAAGSAATACLFLSNVTPAQAGTISMTGTILNLCILTVTTPGLLAVTGPGTELSTTQTGGVAATMTVVATGTNPTITFSTPGITGPSASGSTAEFSYTSAGGANQGFSTGSYLYAMNRLLDTITINGRATNASGFQSGLYTMSATATCAQ